jgi:DNA segregation ATPase FtsK/SpoIIIE, S-DNA-T family
VDRCAQCGFVYEDLAPADVPASLRTLAGRYADLLKEPGKEKDLGTRPAPSVWSVLEYTCHVRDVLLVQRERTLLALVQDCPRFPPMYREERVTLARYGDQAIGEVVDELVMAARLIAGLFEGLTTEQLGRRCIYNYPEPTERDLAWLGRHTVHETAHHLEDVHSGITSHDPVGHDSASRP